MIGIEVSSKETGEPDKNGSGDNEPETGKEDSVIVDNSNNPIPSTPRPVGLPPIATATPSMKRIMDLRGSAHTPCKTPNQMLKIPASPMMTKIGYGTGKNAFRIDQY